MIGSIRFFQTFQLSDVENGRGNNLNLLRFLFASSVILSHCYGLLGLFADEPVKSRFNFTDMGGISVFSFFFISGYLILKSALRSLNTPEYVAARFLRIFPGLLTVALLCLFIIGPIATSLPVRHYFENKVTFAYLNVLMLRGTQRSLPGLFERGNSQIVNGPLWTLPVEWTMYIVTWTLCLIARWKTLRLSFDRRSWIVLIVTILFTAQMMPLPWKYLHEWVLCFALGSACYLARNRITLSIPLAIVLIALNLSLISFAPNVCKHIFPVTLCYLVLTLGYHPAVHVSSFHRVGDYSYGLYIYAYPLQQLLVLRFMSPLKLFAAAYPLALLAAVLSWHFIEAPSLKLKNRIKKRTSRAAQEEVRVGVILQREAPGG